MSITEKYNKYFDIESIIKDIKSYLPHFNEKKFIKAFKFAEEAHKNQFRKDNKTPYIVHPIAALEILISMYADEATLIATLLHDVPEDTKYTLEDVEKNFGKKIAFLVEGITKLSKVHYKHNMPKRQIESLKKLLLHSIKDVRVILIKLADRFHNMQTLQNIEENEKRIRIATETLEIYVPIANLLGVHGLKESLEYLCFQNLYSQEFNIMKAKFDKNSKDREKKLKDFQKILKKDLILNNIEATIIEKNKNYYSIYKKLKKENRNLENIDERLGIKIIVDNTSECYQLLGIIHNKFTPKIDRFRDYIANRNNNSYQSLHTSVFGINGTLTEIQIKTKKMELIAKYGIATSVFHVFEKDKISLTNLKNYALLKNITKIDDTTQESDIFIKKLKSDILQKRIFVFTPKGDPVDLPENATVLDFAFAIHEDVGTQALKAEINGKIRSLGYQLKTGNVVRIIKDENIKPNLAWLSFVKTNLARNYILNFLKKSDDNKKIKEGYKILQKELDIERLGLFSDINLKKINENLGDHMKNKPKKIEELLSLIGEGSLNVRKVISILKKHTYSNKKNNSIKKKLGNQNMIKLEIKIISKNRFRLMEDISEILYKHAIDMYSFKGWVSKSQKQVVFISTILVEDSDNISAIFHELDQIEEVISTYRISKKAKISMYFFIFLIIFLWIFHPLGLSLLMQSAFAKQYSLISNIIIYSTFIFLFLTLILWIKMGSKYFPIFRNKKIISVVIFIIPLLTLGILFLEYFYLNLALNWQIVFAEILIIYSYIAIIYFNYVRTMKHI